MKGCFREPKKEGTPRVLIPLSVNVTAGETRWMLSSSFEREMVFKKMLQQQLLLSHGVGCKLHLHASLAAGLRHTACLGYLNEHN